MIVLRNHPRCLCGGGHSPAGTSARSNNYSRLRVTWLSGVYAWLPVSCSLLAINHVDCRVLSRAGGACRLGRLVSLIALLRPLLLSLVDGSTFSRLGAAPFGCVVLRGSLFGCRQRSAVGRGFVPDRGQASRSCACALASARRSRAGSVTSLISQLWWPVGLRLLVK